jgi:DNA-binding protein HU-beta
MTKTQLELALAEATQTDKKTAGAFLSALGPIAYKAVKKEGEFVLPGLGKLVKQKRAARMGFNPQTRQKVKVAAKTVVKFRLAKGANPNRSQTLVPNLSRRCFNGWARQLPAGPGAFQGGRRVFASPGGPAPTLGAPSGRRAPKSSRRKASTTPGDVRGTRARLSRAR